MGEKTKVLRL